MSALYTNLYHFCLIFLGKSGPHNLEKSLPLFALLIFPLMYADSAIAAKATGMAQETMIYFSIIKLIITSIGIWFWLRMHEVQDRFHVTFLALIAIGVVAQFAKMPLLPITPDKPRAIAALSGFILLWQLVASIKVVNRAVSLSMIKTGVLLIFINIVAYTVASHTMSAVIGEPIHIKSVPYSNHR